MKRRLKIVLSVIVFLGVLLIALLSVAVVRPEWILTSSNLLALVEYFGDSANPQWEEARIEIRSLSWNQKEIRVHAKNICVDHPKIRGCFEVIEHTSLWSWPYPIRPLQFEQLVLKATQLELPAAVADKTSRSAKSSKKVSLPTSEAIQKIAEAIRPNQWEQLDVSIQNLVKTPNSYTLRLKSGAEPQTHIDFSASDGQKFEAKGTWTDLSDADSRVHAEVRAAGYVVSGDLNTEPSSAKAYRVNLAVTGAGWNQTLQVPLSVRWDQSDLTLEGSVSSSRWARLWDFAIQSKVMLDQSRLAVHLENKKSAPQAKLYLDCRLVQLGASELSCATAPQISLAADFSMVVDLLRSTPYAVFAPFHVLRGPVTLDAKLDAKGDQASVKLQSDLASKEQRLKVQVDTQVQHLQNSADRSTDVQVTLDDVELQLPNIDPRKTPDISWDARIKNAASLEARPKLPTTSSAFSVEIKTNKPLRLRSNLAVEPVPLEIDYKISNQSQTGSVAAQPFNVEFFRKKAKVQKLKIASIPGSKEQTLDGLVEYTTSEAKIYIHLTGRVSKPNIHFTSEPPLEQNQILSVLLFGRSVSEALSPDEASTVGNTEAAFASGAFGLASLYIFASTPIESVAYNPVTHAYALRVRLPGGISAEYGSNFGEEEHRYLAFRRRIGKHWMISTELEDFSEQQTQSVSTFLQWFTRY